MVLLFLQNWRSAIIPLVAVPVAIIGTFAVMAVMGFSLNNLTLFGLVLAIGIVVDDAIVVVEAVEHHIEQGLAPREATIKAMSQVSGPVIAVGLVLSAVFVPCAFISGITGQFFRQFALTIAASTIISAFNSLTLSPALAALLLRPRDKETHEALPRLVYPLVGGWLGYALAGAAGWPRGWSAAGRCFRRACGAAGAGRLVDCRRAGGRGGAAVGWLLAGRWQPRPAAGSSGCSTRVSTGPPASTPARSAMLLRVSVLVLVVYGGLLVLTYWGFTTHAQGVHPAQDKGYLMVNVQLPDAASAERTRRGHRTRAADLRWRRPGVKHTVAMCRAVVRCSSANGSNFGSMFVILDDFCEPASDPELYGRRRSPPTLRSALRRRDPGGAWSTVLPPPPVRGVGRTRRLQVRWSRTAATSA